MNENSFISQLIFSSPACIYVITGTLYSYGFKEESGSKIHEFAIKAIPKGEEVSVMLQTLKDHHLKLPSNTDLWNLKATLA